MRMTNLPLAAPVAACLMLFCNASFGQGSTEGATEPVTFFAGERLWAATWQQLLFDAKIQVQNPANPVPVVQSGLATPVSNVAVMPLTVLGLRYRDFTASASIGARTGFSSEGLVTGDTVHRSEWDLNLSYSILPNVAASLVYKSGKIDQGATTQGASLTGVSGGYKLDGLLVGLSVSAPLTGAMAVYGNVAVGPLRDKVELPILKQTYHGTYRVGEFGLGYRVSEGTHLMAVKSLSLTAGYRIQVVDINSIGTQTYSTTTPPAVLASQSMRAQSTTQGLVLGVMASF